MAKINKIKKWVDGVLTTIYPLTIPQAVIDPTSGKSARAELDEKAAHGYGAEPRTLKQVDDEVFQLAGDVNQTDAKIKDIENILSTSNPSQSAQISVSGVSPLALPKNASNGGMSIKLEGLTDAGVNFTPTGRVRSVGKNIARVPKNRMTLGGVEAYADGNSIVIKGTTGGAGVAIRLTDIIKGGYGVGAFETLFSGNTIGGAGSYVVTISRTGTGGGIFAYRDNANLQLSTGVNTIPVVSSLSGVGFYVGVATSVDARITIQIERGTVASVIEAYRDTKLYLTAPELRSNGTVKDEIRKGANGYELVKRISDVDGTVLTTPVITPISYGGVLNSASNGTVYHEPIIADAGVYGTNMPILLTDYPIASIEEIIKHENGVDAYLNVASAVIAGDGLSFTHPDLTDGALVLFTYAFDKESTNGNITATFYDSNVVKIDTVTGKAYKITDVVTNGVLTRTLTEV